MTKSYMMKVNQLNVLNSSLIEMRGEFPMKYIEAKQLKEQLADGEHQTIIDVRAHEKFMREQINEVGAEVLNIPKKTILEEKDFSSIPNDRPLLITCTTGNSARRCAEILHKNGYDVTVLEGGMTSWKNIQ